MNFWGKVSPFDFLRDAKKASIRPIALCSYPLKLGSLKVFYFKTLLRFWFGSKNVQTFLKWCKSTRSLYQIFFCTKLSEYFWIYLQKTWTAGRITLKFCVLSNEAVPGKKLENNNFIQAAVLGANISQIVSPPFSSEKNCEIFVASPWVFLMSHSTRP